MLQCCVTCWVSPLPISHPCAVIVGLSSRTAAQPSFLAWRAHPGSCSWGCCCWLRPQMAPCAPSFVLRGLLGGRCVPTGLTSHCLAGAHPASPGGARGDGQRGLRPGLHRVRPGPGVFPGEGEAACVLLGGRGAQGTPHWVLIPPLHADLRAPQSRLHPGAEHPTRRLCPPHGDDVSAAGAQHPRLLAHLPR